MPQILVENLTKTFRVARRRAGLWGAVTGLVHRTYHDIQALAGIDFTIEESELVVYIGPNGAGKSTTVKILSGILVPSTGRCEVNGVIPWKNRLQHVQSIGVVFWYSHALAYRTAPTTLRAIPLGFLAILVLPRLGLAEWALGAPPSWVSGVLFGLSLVGAAALSTARPGRIGSWPLVKVSSSTGSMSNSLCGRNCNTARRSSWQRSGSASLLALNF